MQNSIPFTYPNAYASLIAVIERGTWRAACDAESEAYAYGCEAYHELAGDPDRGEIIKPIVASISHYERWADTLSRDPRDQSYDEIPF